jgi:excisionase family DNA binding protein
LAEFGREVNGTPDDLISLDEAASVLAVSRRTIDRLVASGELVRYKKVGDRKVYVSRGTLRKFARFVELREPYRSR